MRRASALAFVVAGLALFLQILVHRIIAAKLLNNFAFFVISLTMLGFAVSGVLLTRVLPRVLANARDSLAAFAALLVITTLATAALFYRIDVMQDVSSRPAFVLAFLRMMPCALLFALPFGFCGLILGALLSAPGLDARVVYAADLAGSAIGALLVTTAISALGVESALLLGCAAMLVATLLLIPPRGAVSRALVGVAIVATIGCAMMRDRVFEFRYPSSSTLGSLPRSAIEAEVWDPVARIEVSRIPPVDDHAGSFPSLIGANAAFHQRFRRMLTQNNFAYTYAVDYDGTRESLKGIEETTYAAAYQASVVAKPRVAIIGVGGGFDVLTALYFEASKITAIEINAATVSILRDRFRDYFAKWVGDPRVNLVLGEGRHHLRSTDERYDVLQLSGVDSYAGTAAAAHVFSESYLYTAEAFDLYLSKLSDDGILNMMRLEHRPQREMLRALATAVAALRRTGVEHPARHVVMVSSKPDINFTALLVKRTPFTTVELERLRAWAEPNPYLGVSAAPGVNASLQNEYQRFLSLDDPRLEELYIALYPWNIAPSTDDRPFFFRHSYWWHIFPASPMVWSATPVMEYSLILLFLGVGLVTILCVWWPLRHLDRAGERLPAARRYALYFAGAGVGYLAIEVALLQRFGLFLGHPNYALTVVLAALLFATGVGSLFSAAITRALGGARFIAYALAGIVLLEHAFAMPRLAGWVEWPFALRVLATVALVAPIGVCLGTFIPAAIERVKALAPRHVPWAWGINGIFSVLAPLASVGLSMTWGIEALLLSAIPVYLMIGFALPEPRREA